MTISTLDAEQTALVVVDIQARLASAIADSERLIERALFLIRAARQLTIPILFTEHYPKGLGATVGSLIDAAGKPCVFEKIHFDASLEPNGLLDHLQEIGRDQIMVMGCETHVCVMQTALGLKRQGLSLSLAVDATGSRRQSDRAAGIERMKDAGIMPVSTEMAVFEWLKRGDHPTFKSILPLIRDLQPDGPPTTSTMQTYKQ